MARKTKPGGGWQAVAYTLNKAMEVGPLRLWRRMRSKNACKTCALGMGGMKGGMVNEAGHFPEVCKKSLQAQSADMYEALPRDYFEDKSLEKLLSFSPKQAEDQGRISYPVMLKEGADHFETISWDQALDTIAKKLKQSDGMKSAFYASGRSSNEAAFLLQSFARVYGSNNVMNCSYYCHQASGVGLGMAFGTGTATVELDDIKRSDLVFIIGANPASNHPRLMTQLADLKERGGEVVVINPLVETGLETFHVPSKVKSMLFGTKISSLYVQPVAGGDTALFLGLLKACDENGSVDKAFLEAHSNNHKAVLEHARGTEWNAIEKGSGVDRATIEKVASMIKEAKSTIFAWAMGITHHKHGVENVLAICNLAIATGNVGRPGAGMMPIRGHSNVQGVGSIGFTPALKSGIKESLEKLYNIKMPDTSGYDTYAMMEAGRQGKLDFLFCLGGNLWGSNPDLTWAGQCMQNIDTIVYLSTKLNPGHFHGRGKNTIILPVLARDEEPQATTQESMFNFVRLSEGGTPNVGGFIRAESDIICDIATRVLGSEPVNWRHLKSHKAVRKLISQVVPGWEEIANIDKTGREFTIEGRVYHQPQFKTPSGKAEMHITEMPEIDHESLKLMTIRSEGQFNTVVYEEHDIYRGIPHRYCILISQEDADKFAVKDGQRVKVTGEAGEMENIEVVVGKIKEGTAAMFYPESNVLIKPNIDSRSKTPAFKCAPVKIIA